MSLENIEFRTLTIDEYEAVMDFLAEHYIKMEPGSRLLEFTREESDSFAAQHVKRGLRHGVNIGAYDSLTGKMVSVMINAIGKQKDAETETDSTPKSLKVKQYDEHGTYMTGTNVSKTLGTSNWFEEVILSTDKEYAKRGIGLEMARRSEAIAIEKGCDVIFAFVSSDYSYRIAVKHGYEIKKEVACADYVDPFTNKKIFESVEKPHLYLRLVVKSLKK